MQEMTGAEIVVESLQREQVDGPALLDIRIPPEENVYPMVPPGAGVQEMIDAADE